MGKYKTSYSTEWEKSHNWLQKCTDKKSAACKICKTTFKVDNGGLSQVKSHEKSKKHCTAANTLAGQNSQSVLRVGANSELEMSKGEIF